MEASEDAAVTPLNIMEYTFSEKMLFANTSQLQRLSEAFPLIRKRDVRPFVRLAALELEGQTPRVGGVSDARHFLAVRQLVRLLYRETDGLRAVPPEREILDYLSSLNVPDEASRELVDSALAPGAFERVPRSVRIYPTVASARCLVDLSYCRRNAHELRNSDAETRLDVLRNRVNVILLLQLSNGRREAVSVKWHRLANVRLQIAEALENTDEADRAFQLQQQKDKQSWLIMKSEGHS